MRFLLFRSMEITKPFPHRCLESLREGIGIVMNDGGARLYSLIVLRVLLHLGMLR